MESLTSQDQFDDSILENMLSTLSSALTVSRKTTLSNGVADAVVLVVALDRRFVGRAAIDPHLLGDATTMANRLVQKMSERLAHHVSRRGEL